MSIEKFEREKGVKENIMVKIELLNKMERVKDSIGIEMIEDLEKKGKDVKGKKVLVEKK